MKKILLFQLKPVCYDSYIYFSNSLAAQLRSLGHEVEIFSTAAESVTNLERLTDLSFDAVIDFNSDLPKLKMEDDTYFLDQINSPFYNVILDHPLYHHDMLKQPLCNFHVLCLDHNHNSYIQNHYPHIRSVHVWAMTGEECKRPYPLSKDIDLLFTGTYTSSSSVTDAMDKIPDFLKDITLSLIQFMKANPSLTQEAALTAMLPSLDEIAAEKFPLYMQACFYADTYQRASRRESLLLDLADSGLSLSICGSGWRNSEFAQYSNIKIMDEIPFFDTFSLFLRSKIVLNMMPGFLNGTHDRVYSSMLNHSICLTDATPVLKDQFIDGTNICFYDPSDRTSLPATAARLLADYDRYACIAEAGYDAAIRSHTWQARVADLIPIIFPESSMRQKFS